MDASELGKRATNVVRDVRRIGRRTMQNPVDAVVSALVAGFAFGLLVRLFERPRREPGEK